LRGVAYDRGLLPSARLDGAVVSIGNLTAGGTGKTPLVVLIARELQRRGRRPAIASRGYGASKQDPQHRNDEAQLLSLALPGVPTRQNADRLRAGQELIELGADCVLLDDGFQHRRLARDLDLVLIDATRPWGLPAPVGGGAPVRALLPRGLLREPLGALARADALVLSRVDQVSREERFGLLAELQRRVPGTALLEGTHRPSHLWAGGDSGEKGDMPPRLPLAELSGRSVELVSAIGNPEAFERTVEALGARVESHRVFPDHHRYRPADLEGLGRAGRALVTTEKDAVKLPPALEFFALAVEFRLESGEAVLEALLDALPRSSGESRRANLHAGLAG
jgi:tetraacyldisaccharide 4'-kinase